MFQPSFRSTTLFNAPMQLVNIVIPKSQSDAIVSINSGSQICSLYKTLRTDPVCLPSSTNANCVYKFSQYSIEYSAQHTSSSNLHNAEYQFHGNTFGEWESERALEKDVEPNMPIFRRLSRKVMDINGMCVWYVHISISLSHASVG